MGQQHASHLPPIWNIPHRRNPNFTGREDLLGTLHEVLAATQAVALPQTLYGLGGIGKTQIAVEYAYRHVVDYDVVWWVRSEELATLASDYAILAHELKLPEKDAPEQGVTVAAVRRWLERHTRWLLIFDNVIDPSDLQVYQPRSMGGRTLVTSRNPAWGGITQLVQVRTMEADEAVNLLLKRSNQIDRVTAEQLAEALGFLPLALVQAGAYIEQTGRSLSNYLDLFQKHQTKLLIRDTSDSYPYTIATTWNLAFQQISRPSRDLLSLCAFFAPDNIPIEMLIKGREYLPDPLVNVVIDELELDSILASLRRYSLIERVDNVISIHRMVQAVARDQLDHEETQVWARVAVELAKKAFPFDSNIVSTWSHCAPYLPHILTAAGHTEFLQLVPETTGHVFNQAGLYLREQAEFIAAKVALEKALSSALTLYGSTHHIVAIRLNNLGMVVHALGDFAEAQIYYQQALTINEAIYGPDHPMVAVDVNNLGSVLQDHGNFQEAYAHYLRALTINQLAYGSHHPAIATNATNVGILLYTLGKYMEAQSYYQQALTIDETVYGSQHPAVARDLNNIGLVLHSLGDLAAAQGHFQRALTIDEAIYGPNHPSLATYANNLGSVLREQGDLIGARRYCERAMMLGKTVYGSDHPTIASFGSNLGNILYDMGEFTDALIYYQRALRIDELIYGYNHPEVAKDINNLGKIRHALGDIAGAYLHYTQAFEILCQSLGEDHPDTVLVKHNYQSLQTSPLS